MSKDTSAIFSLKTARKTIVNNFQPKVLILINKNVLWLQISVAEIFIGVEIIEALEYLNEVMSAYLLTESSSLTQIGEKIHPFDILLNDVADLDPVSILFIFDRVLSGHKIPK